MTDGTATLKPAWYEIRALVLLPDDLATDPLSLEAHGIVIQEALGAEALAGLSLTKAKD